MQSLLINFSSNSSEEQLSHQLKEYIVSKYNWPVFNASQHPDWQLATESITQAPSINEVRTVQNWISQRPLQHSTKVIILPCLDQASIPAQNALLKILEEPPEYVLLVATTLNPNAILPTIQSRCVQDTITITSNDKSNNFPATTNELLELITNKDIAGLLAVTAQAKDRQEVIFWLTETLHQLHNQPPTHKNIQLQKTLLDQINKINHNAHIQLTLESGFLACMD